MIAQIRLMFCLAVFAAVSSLAVADDWGQTPAISSTLGVNGNRLCMGEATRGDLGCPIYAPSLTTAGDISVTGNLSAAKFIGDGSGLTGLNASNVSITTGASGSLVFRDAYGSLAAYSTLSVSSTTSSVGIGAGAPAAMGSNGLYASGDIWAGGSMQAINYSAVDGWGLRWGGGAAIAGFNNNKYMTFTTSGTEALRIVSTGYVGIGTNDPSSTLHVQAPNVTFTIRGTSNAANINRYGAPDWVADTWYNNSTNAEMFRIGTSNIQPQWLIRAADGRPISFMSSAGLFITKNTASNRLNTPSTTLDIEGTLKIAAGAEACDANRLGAIKYSSNAFYICQNTSNGWEPLATSGANGNSDRITSNSQAGVTANSTGYISLTTGGVTGTAYFTPASVLVNAGVSTTGPISGTSGYFGGNVGIGTANPSSSLHITTASQFGGTAYYNLFLGANSGSAPSGNMGFMRNSGTGWGSLGFLNTSFPGTMFLRSSGGGGAVAFGVGNAYASAFVDQVGNFNIAGGTNVSPTALGAAQLNVSGTTRITSWTGINFSSVITPTAPLEVSGTISATILRLSDSPPDACTAATVGSIKVINGRTYTCRM